jgi:hypothetical protein
MKKVDNEEASAGGLLTLVTVFILAGILFLLIGFAVDKVIMVGLKLFSSTGDSQMRFDMVNLQLLVFRAEPFVLLIGLGINHWVNALREYSGAVSLGSLLGGAAEMIMLTVVMITLTLFGGAGIDLVMNTTTPMAVVGAGTELYAAVQYVAPVFYGFMLLVTISIVIQFIVMCVQTVDYSQMRTY